MERNGEGECSLALSEYECECSLALWWVEAQRIGDVKFICVMYHFCTVLVEVSGTRRIAFVNNGQPYSVA